ncbi:MAG: hypothetical protein SGARI_001549 [Bacillariaceae sp.]
MKMTAEEGEKDYSSHSASATTDVTFSPIPVHVVTTDTAEHLNLMQTTVDDNLQTIFGSSKEKAAGGGGRATFTPRIDVCEYLWGNDMSSMNVLKTEGGYSNSNSTTSSITPFDLIIGSDLAYRNELHDPLIAAFEQFCNVSDNNNDDDDRRKSMPYQASSQNPVILLGVTMTDTKPIFFEKLRAVKFCYEKLADHLLEPQFRGTQFGIFVVRKER